MESSKKPNRMSLTVPRVLGMPPDLLAQRSESSPAGGLELENYAT